MEAYPSVFRLLFQLLIEFPRKPKCQRDFRGFFVRHCIHPSSVIYSR